MRPGYCAAKIAPDSAFQGARGDEFARSEGDVKTNTRVHRTVKGLKFPLHHRPDRSSSPRSLCLRADRALAMSDTDSGQYRNLVYALWTIICGLHRSAYASLRHEAWLEFPALRKSSAESYNRVFATA